MINSILCLVCKGKILLVCLWQVSCAYIVICERKIFLSIVLMASVTCVYIGMHLMTLLNILMPRVMR
jgi:hypothetical protein